LHSQFNVLKNKKNVKKIKITLKTRFYRKKRTFIDVYLNIVVV